MKSNRRSSIELCAAVDFGSGAWKRAYLTLIAMALVCALSGLAHAKVGCRCFGNRHRCQRRDRRRGDRSDESHRYRNRCDPAVELRRLLCVRGLAAGTLRHWK